MLDDDIIAFVPRVGSCDRRLLTVSTVVGCDAVCDLYDVSRRLLSDI